MNSVLKTRRCGVLLHPTSLPGLDRNGTLGAEAYRFVDFLSAAGFSVWQTLPIGPVDSFGSPYCQRSTFAGDVRLIDIDALRRSRALPNGTAFSAVRDDPLAAYTTFIKHADARQASEFAAFIRRHQRWVFSYAMFELCHREFDDQPWWQWPREYRDHEWDDLVALVGKRRSRFRGVVFQQYLFDTQWRELREYARGRGVHLFGDVPFYVDRDGVDVWSNRRFFRLGPDGFPEAVAGVPPDYFNEDGQYWGNPLYDWDELSRDGFAWWIERIRAQLRHFDMLRIDHFRALDSFWEIPASAETARDGVWRPAPGRQLLSALCERQGSLPLVAEDLGIITDDVRELRDEFALPGMAVLQFAFDGSTDNPHLPQNLVENSVAYTGTHDNDTLRGWYDSLDEDTHRYVREALNVGDKPVSDALIDAVYASPARLTIVPLQDLIGLGSEARMNTPGRTWGNWSWRFEWDQIPDSVAQLERQRAAAHGRLVA